MNSSVDLKWGRTFGRHHTVRKGNRTSTGWASLWENPKLVYDLMGLSEGVFGKGV